MGFFILCNIFTLYIDLGTTTDDDQQLPELENDALGSTNENGSESNCQPTRTLSNADTEDESEFSSSTNFDNVSLSASIEDTQEQPNDDNSLFQEGQSTASPSEKCIFSDSDDCDKETHGTAPPSESSIFSDNDDYDKILYEKFVKKCQRSYKLKTFVKPHYKGTLRKRVINSPRNRTIIRKERVPLVSAKQSSKSLIKPTLVPDTCGATTCIISNSTAKKIDWAGYFSVTR
ncbi:uncharacterized protein [Dysidea avara]|uniref:uncharacterized protein n=1 Tax=Dysidea avara TaxID=196820 RepID=UPI003328E6E5